MKTIDDAVFSSKWDVLKILATSPKTPTELAQLMNTSLANISQQLKLLEAYGLVTKEKKEVHSKKVGKPTLQYKVSKDIAHIGIAGDGFADKRTLSPNDFTRPFITVLAINSPEEACALLKFFLTHEELLQKCSGIGFLKITKDNIELFLETELIDEVRKKYSQTAVQFLNNRAKKIICWTHSDFEIDEGLKRKDPYFVNMLKNMTILMDKNRKLAQSKRLA